MLLCNGRNSRVVKRPSSILWALAAVWFLVTAAEGQDRQEPRFPAMPDLAPAEFVVTGISGTTATLTAADLYKLPQQTIKANDHGAPVTFQGVLLADVLAKVETPTGELFSKYEASYYLIAEGQDGYKAVFSFAEVDPSFSDRRIYIVIQRNGLPLSPKDGPFQVIVPDEKRNSRWVRQLKELRIEPLPTGGAYDSEAVRWLSAAMVDMQSIKPGMTRGDLLKVFKEEGGISTRTWRRYAYGKCGYIKVDVDFEAVGEKDTLEQNPNDRITNISKPFLEWSIRD